MVGCGARVAPPAHSFGRAPVVRGLVPLFRLERFLPWRIGQSLIAIGEVPA